jgi:hypothetical protein
VSGKLTPHVTVEAGNYRAVFDPILKQVVIEKRDQDALGVTCWVTVSTIKTSGRTCDLPSWPLYVLLSGGGVA